MSLCVLQKELVVFEEELVIIIEGFGCVVSTVSLN